MVKVDIKCGKLEPTGGDRMERTPSSLHEEIQGRGSHVHALLSDIMQP